MARHARAVDVDGGAGGGGHQRDEAACAVGDDGVVRPYVVGAACQIEVEANLQRLSHKDVVKGLVRS